MDFVFHLILIIVLVLLNAFFVAAEFSLVAVRKTRIDELVKQGRRRALLVQKALKDLDSYISATQLGITIASLGLGWVGEPSLARFLLPVFSSLTPPSNMISAHAVAFVIAFSLITILHIVVGEIAPKTIAMQRAEPTSFWVIAPLLLFTKVTWPAIVFLNNASGLVLRVVGLSAPSSHQLVHSEEEIKMLLEQSSMTGVIPENEVEMVRNVFKMGDVTVRRIMIPRTDIVAFNSKTTLSEVVEKIEKNLHSRFPVYERSIDNIVGFIHVKDVYQHIGVTNKDTKLKDLGIIRHIIHLPERKMAILALRDLRRSGIHMAVVNDEYGGTAGFVTLENIIEGIVGDIEDEFDTPKRFIKVQKDKSYLIAGQATLEQVQKKTPFRFKSDGYTTIGGYIFGLLGREPKVGDTITLGDMTGTIEGVKGERITLVRLKKDIQPQPRL